MSISLGPLKSVLYKKLRKKSGYRFTRARSAQVSMDIRRTEFPHSSWQALEELKFANEACEGFDP